MSTATIDAPASTIHQSNRTRVAVNTLPDGTREVTTSNSALSLFWQHGEVRTTFTMREACVCLPRTADMEQRRRDLMRSAMDRRRGL
ncbi:MAG: hypothetical protein Q8N06_02870 [Hydrogenophaga sp.]|nr:hypothetical protein [Hydrogenophaga sp.]